MRKWMSVSLMALIFTSAAFAQDSRMKRLDTLNGGQEWDAVGRLDLDGKGFCTGALIAPDRVLTAAHCLFDKRTGARIDHHNVQFLAGWRNGRASAYRTVRRAVLHPDYSYARQVSADRVRNDIALLELERPIRNGRIKPFETGMRPKRGDHVGVVSYARDRSEAPSLQEVCDVLARQEGVLVTTCSVDFGSSGAPIFMFRDGGVNIVSVVSAKAESEGQRVSLGTSLAVPLDVLRSQLDAGHGYYAGAERSERRIKVGERQGNGGAKFVRPAN